ncbi:MAG: leucine-rich repeat domain-containing protein [Lachnospiraceae bacterium]|nr:leucine-rich repeat domain-containing protein [Lachnospiraceae bacterium]
MAKTSKKTTKTNKKNKLYLKKSARWTIAGLMLATAIIIALIPVQNGGVHATTSTPNVIPSTSDLCDNHGLVDAKVYAGSDDVQKAFPFKESFKIGSITYNVIDMSGMPHEETVPVPIFEITKGDQDDYKYIKKYIGGGTSPYLPTSGINLQNSVCINLSTDYNNNFIQTSDPNIHEYKYGDADVKDHNKAGRYTYYTEQRIDRTENGQNYSYFIITEVEHEVKGHNDESGNFVFDSDDAVEGTQKTKYCTKDSSANALDGIKDILFIGDDAFKGEGSITSITIPAAITKIGERAFKDCANISTVNIGSQCVTIGDEAFSGCSALRNINIEDGSLQQIGDCAFYGCTGLTDFKFPHTAAIDVGSGAFAECTSLSNFDFSNAGSTVNLGCNVFANDTALNKISLVGSDNINGVSTINKHTSSTDDSCGIFNNCQNLEYAVFPKNYSESLPKGTFAGCKKLGYVEFLNGDASIEDQYEFSDELINGRFYIWGPDEECSIKDYAATVGATYRSSVPPDTNIDNYELRRNGYKYDFTIGEDGNATITKISVYNESVAGDTLTIPHTIGGFNIKSIGDNACSTLSKPAHVLIPDSVDYIGNAAFFNMPNLKDVEFVHNIDPITNESIPASTNMTIGNSCFANNPKLTKISLRTYDNVNGTINDPVITELGDKAFFTGSDSLTIHGRMDPTYKPYLYAINPENRVNPTQAGYITYETQIPDLLVCKYDPTVDDGNGGVSLISYPTYNTQATVNGTNKTVQDIINEYNADPMAATDIMRATKDCFEKIIIPEGITTIENANSGNMFKNLDGTTEVILGSVQKIPDNAFSSDKDNPGDLMAVTFLSDVIDTGVAPFENSSNVSVVSYYGDSTAQGYDAATPENPYFWMEEGIIYSYDGTDTTLVECLPSKGSNNDKVVSPRSDITKIEDNAFYNCNKITEVLMGECNEIETIPENCFADCDNLRKVVLPESCDQVMRAAFAGCRDYMEVVMPSIEYDIDDKAFEDPSVPIKTLEPKIFSYEDSAAIKYAKRMGYDYELLDNNIVATFYNIDGTIIESVRLTSPGTPKKPETDPVHPSGNAKYKFIGWSPEITEISVSTAYVAQYEDTEASSSTSGSSSSGSGSSTGSGSSSGSGSNGSGSSSSSTNKSSSSSSSSTTKSSSGSSTYNRPVVISGAPTPVVQPGSANSSASGGAASSSPSGSNVTTGNTNVVSTAPGLSNNGKMSATVNGSSDNYVIKLTETAEADECAKQALSAAFGSLDNIRYMPFDISLYDSTGTQKISPVPEGVTVSVTMPIPDSLQVYGGNNKVASTVGGTLESIKPRFTVIDGVPCMNFTVSHLSPYVIYVDTANLTASGTLDATPKTGDPIHPKWFLCIGLTAISIFLFLKRDKDTLRAA